MSKIFQQLYAKASTGKIKQWEIEADGNIMKIRNGYTDGKIKESTKVIVGKNIGRANETTPEEQCELECQSKWNKKIDEQYVESLDAVGDYSDNEILLPMLAHKYTERKHNIKFPCYVQPKLNGVRCIFQNEKFVSRKGKIYDTLNHLREELSLLGINIPDGEIYIHGMDFQSILSRVKKDHKDGTSQELEYWIYDQVNNEEYDARRMEILRQFTVVNKIQDFTKLKLVDTYIAENEDDIKNYHDKFVREGFEGVIIRNADGLYKIKHRSSDLQKYKEFIDEEYKITGFTEGTGPEVGCIVYECYCEGAKNNLLSVRPRGSFDLRKKWFADGKSVIGKELTVRFQEKSKDGVPLFPVGICVRDYE